MAIKTPAQTIIDTSQDGTFTDFKSTKSKRNKAASEAEIIEKYRLPLFHWTTDQPDNRDYIYKNIPVRTPATVDLRQYCTPIEDQGALGSCTGQAVAGAIEYLNKRRGRSIDVSRLFIYYYTRALIGTTGYDSGGYIRDSIKAVYNRGAPLEKLWPYLISRFTQAPSTTARNDALRRRVTLYERITV
jgi:C1A family cysteine protease